MAPSPSQNEYTLPQLQEAFTSLHNTSSKISKAHVFYDVKFWPYYPPTLDVLPLFAVTGDRQTLLCRASCERGKSAGIVKVFRDLEPMDDDGNAILNSCDWNYVSQEEPLLSLAGPSGKVKVLNATNGELVTTLIGHGGEINDLATHPQYPWILASGSADQSIRIWDLRRRIEHGENACLVICGHGQAHKEGILTLAWHGGGRYLVSGGLDHMICLWTLPDLSPTSAFFGSSRKEGCRSVDETTVIHYPHFVTSAIHSNFVDCVRFYGDLIVSKSAGESDEHKKNNNQIVLW